MHETAQRRMPPTFAFRRADRSDDDLIGTWFHAPHVGEYWGEASTNVRDFRDAMTGRSDLFNYWIGQIDGVAFCLLITTNAAVGSPEHLAPFVPDTGEAWTLDVLIGVPEYVGRGLAAPMLESFLRHVLIQKPTLRTVLIDPEARNSRAIHVYEKAGFQKVSEFTPSAGSFQGRPHVLLAHHYAAQRYRNQRDCVR